jgi:hypothetical protein
VLFLLLLTPTVVNSFFTVSHVFKHSARILLGIVLVSSILLFIITDFWWVRATLVIVYFSVKIPLGRRRRRLNNEWLNRSSNNCRH